MKVNMQRVWEGVERWIRERIAQQSKLSIFEGVDKNRGEATLAETECNKNDNKEKIHKMRLFKKHQQIPGQTCGFPGIVTGRLKLPPGYPNIEASKLSANPTPIPFKSSGLSIMTREMSGRPSIFKRLLTTATGYLRSSKAVS